MFLCLSVILLYISQAKYLVVVFRPNAELKTRQVSHLPYIMLPCIFLVAAITTRLAAGVPDNLSARDVVALGPQGVCPAIQETLYELRPIYYSSFFLRNTLIDPLHDGHFIRITNAPTAFILQTYITVVVTQLGNGFGGGTAPVQGGGAATSNFVPTTGKGITLSPPTLRGPSRFSSLATSSNTLSITNPPVVVNGQTITAGASAVTINGTPVSLAAGSTALVIGTQTIQLGSGNSAIAGQTIALNPGIPNLIVDGQVVFPGEVTTIDGIQIIYAADGGYAIIGTQTIFPGFGTATVVGSAISLPANSGAANTGAFTTSTGDLPPLTIGAGIPSGTFTSLPSESPVLLAYSDNNFENRRLMHRQAAATSSSAEVASASAVTVVNLASLTATALPSGEPTGNTLAASECEDATPFILSEGLLLYDGSALGKIRFATTALFGSLTDPPNDQVNKTFSIQNGILHWDTDDVGSAIFWSCNDTLYVGFPEAPDDSCTSIVLGVISAQACEEKVDEALAAASTTSAAATSSVTPASTQSSLPGTALLSNSLSSNPTGDSSIQPTFGSNTTPTLVSSISFITLNSAFSLPSPHNTNLLSMSVPISTLMPTVLSVDSTSITASGSPPNFVLATSVKPTFGTPSTASLMTVELLNSQISSISQIAATFRKTSGESLSSTPLAVVTPSIRSQTMTETTAATFPASLLSTELQFVPTKPSPRTSIFSSTSSAAVQSDGAIDITESLSLPSSRGSSFTNTVSVTLPQMLSSTTSPSF